MKDIITRVSIGIVGIPIILFLIYTGGYLFTIFLIGVGVLSQLEFYNMCKEKKHVSYSTIAILCGIIWIATTYYAPQFLLPIIIASTILFLIINLKGEIKNTTETFAITLAGFLYIPVLISTLILIRQFYINTSLSESETSNLIIVLFVSVWINDTFAYLFGSMFGKRKLAPKISPKKSIEGSIAGIIGVIISVFIFNKIHFLPNYFTLIHLIILSLIFGIFPQIGDLTESIFKRDTGVKDSGKILMGHGGVMDRFDAIFMTAPVVYLFIFISLKLI